MRYVSAYFVWLSLVVAFGCGCGGNGVKEIVPSKINNVSRVFFMGGGSYAVLTEDAETKEIKRQYLDANRYKVRVYADCPNDSKMWVDVVTEDGKAAYIIHVRGSDDIAGGNTGGKSPSPINVVK